MKDLAIALDHRPGALAEMGEALGAAGVSVEGGGAWIVDGRGIGHFLFADPGGAREALAAAGIEVLAERNVVTVRLDQETPGQLGALTRCMADAGVQIEVLYSDHDHRLVLVVDREEEALRVAGDWMEDRAPS